MEFNIVLKDEDCLNVLIPTVNFLKALESFKKLFNIKFKITVNDDV